MLSSQVAADVVQSCTGDRVQELALETETLRGGLVSERVERVTARYRDAKGTARLTRFVVKHLVGAARREAEVYRKVAHAVGEYAPKVLRVEERAEETLLYLEWVSSAVRWPWRDFDATRDATAHLALLHQRLQSVPDAPDWDYEREVEATATKTLRVVEELPREGELASVRRALPAVRRLTGQLRRARHELLHATALPGCVIHGDVHPSNVILRTRGGVSQPVLLDWARLRHGSPLEDLSPWLQSLSHWEPMVARRHDRMLTSYLRTLGISETTPALRDAYWLAAGLNALAGALIWNVMLAQQETKPRAHKDAVMCAQAWARCVTQADRRFSASH